MSATMRRISVVVRGERYHLVSDESDQVIFEAVRLLEGSLQEVTSKYQSASTEINPEKCALMVALKFAVAAARADDMRQKQLYMRAHTIVELIDNALLHSFESSDGSVSDKSVSVGPSASPSTI